MSKVAPDAGGPELPRMGPPSSPSRRYTEFHKPEELLKEEMEKATLKEDEIVDHRKPSFIRAVDGKRYYVSKKQHVVVVVVVVHCEENKPLS